MKKDSFINNLLNGITQRLHSFAENPYRKINLGWFRRKYYKHLPPGKLKRHRIFGKALFFTDSIQLVNGLQEIFIEELYRVELGNQPFIIDCGANIGLSIIYLHQRHPGAEIIAFEPDENNFSMLTKNVASFQLQGVVVRKEAIWISNTSLNFSSEGTMTSKITNGSQGPGVVLVDACRLKDLLNRTVDFLKIDIEGAEYAVLTDIAEQLHLVKNMFIEYHGTFEQNSELTEMFEIITKAGFKYYIKEAATLFSHPFIRKKKSAIEYDVQLNIFCFQ